MPPEENIAVAPSEDNGNISIETEPSEVVAEPTEPETPAEKVETAAPAEPVVELFDLPDGRKVDAATLSKEWKENFLPEFTKKSQALAEKEDINKPISPLADPNYVPQTYEELAEKIQADLEQKAAAKEQKRVDSERAIETAISNEISEVKKTDPTLNENLVFVHANEYREKYGVGFPTFKVAYQHMKDMSELTKTVKQQTATEIAKRNDPVSTKPGATGAKPNPSQFSSSIDYLNAVKASGKQVLTL